MQDKYYLLPPLLVQRCNGTTAGLGYLEANVICPCKSPHWTVDSSADFNPNHNHVNAPPNQASLQTTSRPHHYATSKQILYLKMYSSHYKSVK
jgi:hypothetical protein